MVSSEKQPSVCGHSRKRSRDCIEEIDDWSFSSPHSTSSDDLKFSFFSRLLQYQTIEQFVEQTKRFYSKGKKKSKILEKSCAPFEIALEKFQQILRKKPISTFYNPILNYMDHFWCKQLDRLEKIIRDHFEGPMVEENFRSKTSSFSSLNFLSSFSNIFLFSVVYIPGVKRKKHRYLSDSQLYPRLSSEIVETDRVFFQSSNGTKQMNQYLFLKTIGKGEYSKVKLVHNIQDRLHYAVKVFNRNVLKKKRFIGHGLKRGVGLENIYREIHILKHLSHENIIKLVEVVDDGLSEEFYIVLEHASKGAILSEDCQKLTPIPTLQLQQYLRDIAAGLEYLHQIGIVHRDLKPSNLLLTEQGTVKICDFGVSIILEPGQEYISRQSVGTPAFLPPELCDTNDGSVKAKALDIWALGVTLYMLYFGKLPFWGDNPMELYQSILLDSIQFPSQMDEHFKDLLNQMLTKDPNQRISISEIKNHVWLSKKL